MRAPSLPGLLGALTLATGLWLALPPWPPRQPGPITAAEAGAPAPCPVPVELRGVGLRCLQAEAAAWRGIRAGDAVPAGAGPPAPMALPRRQMLGLRLDINRATRDELLALPGIGPQRALALEAARPLRSLRELAQVPALGPRLAAALAPLLDLPP